MKRKRKWPDHNLPPERVHEAFTRDQLAEVGAVILAWNHLEAVLDDILEAAWRLPDLYTHEVIGRIHGVDGKIALIRIVATNVGLALKPRIVKLVGGTMGAVGECKGLRDAVAHARATKHRRTDVIVQTKGHRGQTFDLIFYDKALAQLADRIDTVALELHEIATIYAFRKAVISLHEDNHDGRHDEDIKSFEQDALEYISQLARLQKRRLSLPPLPEFPKTPPVQPKTGGRLRRRSQLSLF